MVENAKNYKMAKIRQLLLRPILRDGLLTAEGNVWKRSRKAMAPVFAPRHINGFTRSMRQVSEDFIKRYENNDAPFDMAHHMTELTFNILAETLFSTEISGELNDFTEQLERLFETAARVDPLDVLGIPEWVPRITRLRGRSALNYFRKIVKETVNQRREKMAHSDAVPDDFLTLLLHQEGPEGLSGEEIEDNVITFIGAGHETTARALAWTLYLLANAPDEREKVEREAKQVTGSIEDPSQWLSKMPHTRACFEEAMRLYPPAPTISREAIAEDVFQDLKITKGTQVLVMPWTLHRHRLYWENPDAFIPSRFLPENREKLDRYQYLPFGAGPRVCIGSSFALQEAVIALGILCSKYRFDMAPNAAEPWPVQKLTTQPEGGVEMVATRL